MGNETRNSFFTVLEPAKLNSQDSGQRKGSFLHCVLPVCDGSVYTEVDSSRDIFIAKLNHFVHHGAHKILFG